MILLLQIHVWDLRKSYQCLHSYFAYSPPAALDISQKGLLAVGYGSQVLGSAPSCLSTPTIPH